MDNSEGLSEVFPLAPARRQVRVSVTVLPSNTGEMITPRENHPRLKTSLRCWEPRAPSAPNLSNHAPWTGQGNDAFPRGCLDCPWSSQLVKNSRTRSLKKTLARSGNAFWCAKRPRCQCHPALHQGTDITGPTARAKEHLQPSFPQHKQWAECACEEI